VIRAVLKPGGKTSSPAYTVWLRMHREDGWGCDPVRLQMEKRSDPEYVMKEYQ
jgi:hypothetical protein